MNFNDILNKTTTDIPTSSSISRRPSTHQPPQNLASTSNSTPATYSTTTIPRLASPFRTPVSRSDTLDESDRSSCREPKPSSALEPTLPPLTFTPDDANHSTTQPSRKRKAASKDVNAIIESGEDMDNDADQDAVEDGREGEEKPKRKRRRQALSCMPCKRRKIRCDRKHPCTPCTKRNDQAQCRWSVIDAGDRDITGESGLPATSPFPPHIQSPPSQEERYVLRSEYEELKATVGRLESIVATLTGTTGISTAPTQTSNVHSMFPGHSTSKMALPSPVVTSAAPHALYTPVNSTYSASAVFVPPVAPMRPGSSSPPSAGEATGMLKYLNLPHSGSGNSPTSTRSMSSSTSPSADRIGAPIPDTRGAASALNPAPAPRNPGFPAALGGGDSSMITSRYSAPPSRRLTTESSISYAMSRGEDPRPATVRSSSSGSTLSAARAHSHEVRSQSPMERATSPHSRTSPRSSPCGINTRVIRKVSRPPAAVPPTSRAATMARIAPSPHPPAPGILGRVDTEGIEKRNQKASRRELDDTAAAPISSLISVHWNQRQRAEHAPSVKARKRPIESHDILYPSTKFVTAESTHQHEEGSDEDDQDDGRHDREGSACSSVDQLDSSTSTHSLARDTETLRG